MISLLCWWVQILQQDADAAQNICDTESSKKSSLFIGTAVFFKINATPAMKRVTLILSLEKKKGLQVLKKTTLQLE
jgi:hypothetical protein